MSDEENFDEVSEEEEDEGEDGYEENPLYYATEKQKNDKNLFLKL
jgi:hypothetical protein